LITGRFDGHGQPYFTAQVYLPSPVDETIEVQFLADTGSSWTLLQMSDIVNVDLRALSRLARPSSVTLHGLTGSTPPLEARVSIAFVHDNGRRTTFTQTVAIVVPDEPIADLPSLLGMDLLCEGVLTVDGRNSAVTFDVRPEDIVARPPARL
jgi:hypothetical protein